jgi:hypothetical protein
MSSKAQKTTNVYELQDALARAYSGTNEPDRDKKRLGDLWIVEGAADDAPTTKLAGKSKRSLSKLSKFRKRSK